MLVKSQISGVSPKVIAKALQLSKKVVRDGESFLVPGSHNDVHTVSNLGVWHCDCKFMGRLCSHILAVKFFTEEEERKQIDDKLSIDS